MKTKFEFTQGEKAAAIALLAFIVVSYTVYFLYDAKADTSQRFDADISVIEEFNRRQDSLRLARQQEHSPYRPDWKADTIPKGKNKRQRLYDIVKIDLNSCDSNDIMTVPGFGSKRAAKLIEYRDRLGGFYDLSQLKEVYVLKDMDSAYIAQYFKVSSGAVRRININEADYAAMVKHPYFDAYLTRTILNYRSKHGSIGSMEELQKVTHAYPELMRRLRHYVSF